ncbi:histone deacetylase family protein [Schleiferia thermophila]|uniref:Acetoin utilization deacetylase AcuC-like enzyme n=1 Tax=Schleiferia thermophila TaxID=884107 RepID=A0A369A756_9FLAO|nr:histone deacetylase [Schleiferia thermophila]RCX05180.1 acetoin utilization deacetylase AcuC-like enzyme [Schleiferia thermophila]
MLTVAWRSEYIQPLPDGHRFPMLKYELIPEQLIRESIIRESQIFKPEPAKRIDITAVHSEEYLTKLETLALSRSEERKIGFPHDERLVFREKCIVNGSIYNALYAIENGCSINVAGGTHHAYSDRGEGFCLLNDIAVATSYLLRHRLRERVLIVDLDVHQGNGTAAIFKNEPGVFTFSMHGANNYPLHKEQSDLDVPLPDGITDEPYLKLLERHLNEIAERFQPDFVFYQSGVDILHTDKLGRLAISAHGCALRDRLVFRFCKIHRLPVAVSMGGGYSQRLSDIVNAHVSTYREAASIFD